LSEDRHTVMVTIPSLFKAIFGYLEWIPLYTLCIEDSISLIPKYIHTPSTIQPKVQSPQMINDGIEVSFGVEFEHVFAFHQCLLQRHLDNIGDEPRIAKNLSDRARRELNHTTSSYLLTRRQYMGWALTGRKNYELGEGERCIQEKMEENVKKFGCRPYAAEILHVAQPVLPSGVQIHDSYGKKCKDFSTWHLTNDYSLLGVDKATLSAHLLSNGHMNINLDDWDTHGIELVTRVLPYAPSSFDEIEAHLTALKGTPAGSHTAFPTPHCGMHVHIGLPPCPSPIATVSTTPTFKLSTIQHFSYILLLYQPTLSALFPSTRREGSHASWADIAPNTDAFIRELPPFDPNEDWNASPPPYIDPYDFTEGRRMIFKCRTLEQLVKTMCPSGKAHIVNLTYLLRGPSEGGRTIEFRQHEGCLDGEGVRWWVAVCVGLVRVAERMAGKFGCEGGDERGLTEDDVKGCWHSRVSEYDGWGYKTKE